VEAVDVGEKKEIDVRDGALSGRPFQSLPLLAGGCHLLAGQTILDHSHFLNVEQHKKEHADKKESRLVDKKRAGC
jgi:hypothetical protein